MPLHNVRVIGNWVRVEFNSSFLRSSDNESGVIKFSKNLRFDSSDENIIGCIFYLFNKLGRF